MSGADDLLVERVVDVRSWPERPDVMVIDEVRPRAIAIFSLQDNRDAPAWDPFSPYAARAADALQRTEGDQELLRAYYELDDDECVKLRLGQARREKISVLLERHGLDLEQVEMSKLMAIVRTLRAMPVETLYQLLCDWHDVVEREFPEGTTALRPESWVHRASPDKSCHYHYIVSGVAERRAMTQAATARAYEEFCNQVDTELDVFSLGSLLRWVYFHRTEFNGFGLPVMQAVRELQKLRQG